MSDYVTGETTDLFDPITGAWVGVIDKKGKEQLVVGGGNAVEVLAGRSALLTDANTILECNSASAINITIQPSATTNFPDGTILTIYQVGVGASLFVAGAGVTIQGTAPTATQYMHIAVRKRSGDTWAWV